MKKLLDEFLILVQARTGSTRLPNKVLLEVLGKPILIHQLERIKASKFQPKIVVITSQHPNDDVIEELSILNGFQVFRGSEEDVLARHFHAATFYGYKWIVKIPSDCPLIDPVVIDRVFDAFLSSGKQYDYFSNLHPATYPDGNDVEIMHIEALKKAYNHAKKPLEREHTTPYFWENPSLFSLGNYAWETGLDFSMSHRFTLDYPKDWEFISTVFNKLYPINPTFSLIDILQLLEENPSIYQINAELAGVNWYRNHLDELKTINHTFTKNI